MALIKKNEFRQMTEQQLRGRLIDIEKELLKLNGQRAMHTTLESPGRVKLIRKTRARIFTRINELKQQAMQQHKQPVQQQPKKAAEKAKEQQPKEKTRSLKSTKTPKKKETGGKNERHE